MHFCTISTYDHAYKVFALCDSLISAHPNLKLHVLFVDKLAEQPPFEQLHQYDLDTVKKEGLGKDICEKYGAKMDKLRWSLKPVFMRHLLVSQSLESVIYLDNDVCFFEDYRFLFDLLKTHSFLLSPHNYERSPYHNQNMLEANFRVGLYNAGFVGANKNALSSLDWWASCCLYRCEKNALRGTFDDQKYLDLISVLEPSTHVLTHRGCNVAEWNKATCIRSEIAGKVWINDIYPIVFIHFNHTTFRAILQKEDPLLRPFLDRYALLLIKYNPNFELASQVKKPTLLERAKYFIWKTATKRGY